MVRFRNAHIHGLNLGCSALIWASVWSLSLVGCQEQVSEDPAEIPLRLLDLNGQEIDPFLDHGFEATVFLFTRSDCPISNRYAPEVRRLCEQFGPRGIRFFLVCVDPDEDPELIRQHLREYDYPCEALRDPQHRLVELTGAQRTPEAAVFTDQRKMVYRGRINDLYVDFGKARQAPSTHDLAEALEAVLAGQPVALRITEAVGCYISDLR